MPAPSTLPDHASIRAAYPAFKDITYLDTASMGLLAESTMQVADKEHQRSMR